MSTAQIEAEPKSHAPAHHGAPRPPARRGFGALAIVAFLVPAAGVLGGLYYVGRGPRIERQAALDSESEAAAVRLPRVNVATPHRRDKPADLTLPGDLRAFQDADLYARTNGYVKRYLVDIGETVEVGDLLAEIDTPEIDQELKQAQATLEQAKASRNLTASKLDLAGLTLKRSRTLAGRGVETQQALDENEAAFKVAEATVLAADAEVHARESAVRRLVELQKFQKVFAPFHGVITARNIDVGDLISVGMSQPLFRIAEMDRLKAYVNVPQTHVTAIGVDRDAEILVREFPERQFVGKVTRTAGAIDQASRTLPTEILLPNPDGALYAGMYVKVRFAGAGGQPLLIPATTIVINADGTRVAVVGPDGTLNYREVHLGRDYGPEVEVLTGLEGTERLVTNPTENLVEGIKVEVAAPAETKDKP